MSEMRRLASNVSHRGQSWFIVISGFSHGSSDIGQPRQPLAWKRGQSTILDSGCLDERCLRQTRGASGPRPRAETQNGMGCAVSTLGVEQSLGSWLKSACSRRGQASNSNSPHAMVARISPGLTGCARGLAWAAQSHAGWLSRRRPGRPPSMEVWFGADASRPRGRAACPPRRRHRAPRAQGFHVLD